MIKDLVGFYNFWLWEYQRRNVVYQRDYLVYLDEPTEFVEQDFVDKHNRMPKNFKAGCGSEQLLRKVLDDVLDYTWPQEDGYAFAPLPVDLPAKSPLKQLVATA